MLDREICAIEKGAPVLYSEHGGVSFCFVERNDSPSEAKLIVSLRVVHSLNADVFGVSFLPGRILMLVHPHATAQNRLWDLAPAPEGMESAFALPAKSESHQLSA